LLSKCAARAIVQFARQRQRIQVQVFRVRVIALMLRQRARRVERLDAREIVRRRRRQGVLEPATSLAQVSMVDPEAAQIAGHLQQRLRRAFQ
jgi:hypothetical protein